MILDTVKMREGDIVQFIYYGGSIPGNVRCVKIEQIDDDSILGIDIDDTSSGKNGVKRFLIAKMSNLQLMGNLQLFNEVKQNVPQQDLSQVSFIIAGNDIVLYIDNDSYTIDQSHQNYTQILNILNQDDYNLRGNELYKLVDLVKPVQEYVSLVTNTVEFKDGICYYNNNPLHNSLTDRIIELYKNNCPFKPMVKFLENVLLNPSNRAINELYKFLEHKGLPITSDGCFLAYKKVTKEYTDCHTGTVDNSIGCINAMPRNEVCDDFNIGCSVGYHVGSKYYATEGFCSGCGIVMIVKVNPADVVSVPKDCDCQKVRTCKYEVVGELPKDKYKDGLIHPVHSEYDS
jgi:uncharacterized protein YacL (UPF0231 family)